MLFSATTNALKRNNGDLLIEDLAFGCKQVKVSLRLSKENPFEMTTAQLKKAIADSRKRK
jgi:hypothetical protein